jgi:hypothetical protein
VSALSQPAGDLSADTAEAAARALRRRVDLVLPLASVNELEARSRE